MLTRRRDLPQARFEPQWTALALLLAVAGAPFGRLVVLGVLARLPGAINRAQNGAPDHGCSLSWVTGESRCVVVSSFGGFYGCHCES